MFSQMGSGHALFSKVKYMHFLIARIFRAFSTQDESPSDGLKVFPNVFDRDGFPRPTSARAKSQVTAEPTQFGKCRAKLESPS